MSCIRFSTTAQREQFRAAAPGMPGVDTALDATDDVATRMSVPVFTEGKLRRLLALASSPSAKIRESVASNRHAPAAVLDTLAHDGDSGVRSWVARNETAPLAVLDGLARDRDDSVRAWVATNPSTPAALVAHLSFDESETVRGVVRWRLGGGDVVSPASGASRD
ncbi:hypothetical protein [Marisediminicola sp. LYQ134]|uniref:hypothetical protein n=1 Tax=Marisediminicola sp. LYQ134 TaxID=3391061 RepID=UPI0039838D3B